MTLQNQSLILIFLLCISFLCVATPVNAKFDVEAYEQFLESNENLTADELLSQYPADRFFQTARKVDFDSALNSALIDSHYSLTPDEKLLLKKHGFVVTERLSYPSFGAALAEIYQQDLPVYVSTDALLHALHMSYDAILMNVEHSLLIPKLAQLLKTLQTQVPTLAGRYAAKPQLLPMLKDLDVYLTVPLTLLGQRIAPVYPANQEVVDALLAAIQAEQPEFFELFSSTPRELDFSQFRPRGHYTQTFGFPGPSLREYFQAMIWLGRTEIYLSAPKQHNPNLQQKEEDIQRQTILAALIAEAAEAGNAFALLKEIDDTIRFMVGESDNVTLLNILDLMAEVELKDAGELLSVPVWKDFQATLLTKEYAPQRILSQLLLSDPMNPEQIEPASAFLLLGQRFAIDSFVTGNVVYDKIIFNGAKVERMLPSTLDVLFALGNDAAAQLLGPELQQYHYAPNLASLRYLIDTYQLETWDDSLYSGWLNTIRTLKPPLEREIYPSFMQTAAWWQQKMNTQLAAWAQLRHDNLLYVKQSYTPQTVCSFPESFVEPVPEFYEALNRLALNGVRHFQTATFERLWGDSIVNYFEHLSEVAETLAEISRKELDRTPLNPDEKEFLEQMLYDTGGGSGPRYNGWYPRLFITGEADGLMKEDRVVADIHTAPELGIGYVLHAGTGPINLAVAICDLNSDQPHAFIGPVMSYYERITVNFKRLTDEEWQTEYATTPSYRPPFVNLYLANHEGEARGESISLFTRAGSPPVEVQPRGKLILPLGQIKRTALYQNFPNPFNPETWVPYTLAADASVTITIYNVQGEHIRTLNLGHQRAGEYLTKDKAILWDGRNDNGDLVSSGVYFYHLQVTHSDSAKDFAGTKKMIILK